MYPSKLWLPNKLHEHKIPMQPETTVDHTRQALGEISNRCQPTVSQSGRIDNMKYYSVLAKENMVYHVVTTCDPSFASVDELRASVDELRTWTQDQAFGLQGLHRRPYLLYSTGNTYFYAFHTYPDMFFPIHPLSTGWGRKHRSSEEVSRYRNGSST